MKINLHNKELLYQFPYLILFILLFLPLAGCRKLIEVDPPYTQQSAENVFNNDATAIAAITGIYYNLSRNSLGANDLTSVSLLTGLSGDELILYNGSNNNRLKAYYSNQLTSTIESNGIWTSAYTTIYTINSALENLSKSSKLSSQVRQQLIGEAKFLRAFYYFYLVNLYGDVPLVLTTDYSVNAKLPRSSVQDDYNQIVSDLNDSKALLSENYLNSSLLQSTTERVRPTKWAAIAMLARVYLYQKQWANAEREATELIANTTLYRLETIDKVFSSNNSEAIWQLQPINQGWNTEDARFYIVPLTGFSEAWPVYLSKKLLDTFQSDDLRKPNWIAKYTDINVTPNVDYYYAYKYKNATLNNPITEYSVVLRMAEIYLIRAEARAQQDKLPEAADDLDAIRLRAGLTRIAISSKENLITAIYHERQVELFTEWGHRWLDLKRTAKVDEVMSTVTPQKSGTWTTNWQLYPVPQIELDRDPNLTQNPGY
jgi:hypothetical protein